MNINVEISDKLWADFCLYVEGDHGPNCQCITRDIKEPGKAMSAIVALALIEHKQVELKENLIKEVLSEFHIKELPKTQEDILNMNLRPMQMLTIVGRLAEVELKMNVHKSVLCEEYGIGWMNE